jgi:hypothetical protein
MLTDYNDVDAAPRVYNISSVYDEEERAYVVSCLSSHRTSTTRVHVSSDCPGKSAVMCRSITDLFYFIFFKFLLFFFARVLPPEWSRAIWSLCLWWSDRYRMPKRSTTYRCPRTAARTRRSHRTSSRFSNSSTSCTRRARWTERTRT